MKLVLLSASLVVILCGNARSLPSFPGGARNEEEGGYTEQEEKVR